MVECIAARRRFMRRRHSRACRVVSEKLCFRPRRATLPLVAFRRLVLRAVPAQPGHSDSPKDAHSSETISHSCQCPRSGGPSGPTRGRGTRRTVLGLTSNSLGRNARQRTPTHETERARGRVKKNENFAISDPFTRTRAWPCGWRWCPRGSWSRGDTGQVSGYGHDEQRGKWADGPVLEATRDVLHVLHAASTGGVSALRLLSPLVCSRLFFPLIRQQNQPHFLQSEGKHVHDRSLAAG